MEMDEMRSDEELDDDEETGLTHADRRRRRRQKRKNTQLDERVVNTCSVDGNTITPAEEKRATAAMVKTSVGNACLIGAWYACSIGISLYNKWMFAPENLDFHYPLFTTCLHMLVQFGLACAVLGLVPSFRPSHGVVLVNPHDTTRAAYTALRPSHGIGNPHDDTSHAAYTALRPSHGIVSPHEDTHAYTTLSDPAINSQSAPAYTSAAATDPSPPPSLKKPLMTKWFYLTRIGPCGIATGLDIGLGNTSLQFISLTFFTMCKSSVLAFVLLFALLFRLEQPSWRLGGIIALMSAGVVMMVAGETAFNAAGFALIMASAFFSGFRWSLTQILLRRHAATANPFSSIFFLAPIMLAALLLIALPAEGPAQLAAGLRILANAKGAPLAALLLLIPGCIAFLMTAAEFALLQRTSVVTLSVCGIFKEALTISAAGSVFGDKLSPINVSGLLVTIASIAAYNVLRFGNMRAEARREAKHTRPVAAAPNDDYRGRSNSLSVQTDSALPPRILVNNGALTETPTRSSPVKRLEDIE